LYSLMLWKKSGKKVYKTGDILDKRNRGTFYEAAAIEYLCQQGVVIVEKNFRSKRGEIDIIGIDGDNLVFFEVKYRRNKSFGNPLEAIDYRKQMRIVNTAKYYLTYNPTDKYIRFDAIGIMDNEIEWIKNAFFV